MTARALLALCFLSLLVPAAAAQPRKLEERETLPQLGTRSGAVLGLDGRLSSSRIEPVGATQGVGAARIAAGAPAGADLDGRWLELGPPSRIYPRAVFDAAHERFVMFGGVLPFDGRTNRYSNDVWVMATGGLSTWRKLEIDGELPEPRAGHGCVYDPVRHRLILFGGFRAIQDPGHLEFRYLNDAWALTLDGVPHWTRLADGGPSRRTGPACTYDAARDRLLVWGGFFYDDATADSSNFGSFDRDLWELPLGAGGMWHERTFADVGPSARAFAFATVDLATDRLVILSGQHEDSTKGAEFGMDVWSHPLEAPEGWTQLLPTDGNTPLPRSDVAMEWDAARRRLLMMGGYGTTPENAFMLPSLLVFDIAQGTWVDHSFPPAGRVNAASAVDAAADRLYLGPGGGEVTNPVDSWRLALSTLAWTRLDPPGSPLPSTQSSAVFDGTSRRMIVFGGSASNAHGWATDPQQIWYDTVQSWSVDDGSWSNLAFEGAGPSRRGRAATAFDPGRRRMWVLGGEFGYLAYEEAWALELAGTPHWWKAPEGPHPAQRYGPHAVFDPIGDRVLYFGGATGPEHDEIWALSSVGAWSRLAFTGTLPYRFSSNPVFDPKRNRVIAFGGHLASEASDLWALDLAGAPAWHPLTAAGSSPLPRDAARAVYDERHDRVLLFGGGTPGALFEFDLDVHELALEGSPQWRRLAPRGEGAAPRWEHVLAFDERKNRLLVTGGESFYQWNSDSWALQFEPPVLRVVLDVRPGNPTNSLPAHLGGPLPVALLSAADFDPSRVDVASLLLNGAPGSVAARPARDWNGDGTMDLVIDFDGSRMTVANPLGLTGRLLDGTAIEGEATVTPRPTGNHLHDGESDIPVPMVLTVLSVRAATGSEGIRLEASLPAAGAWRVELYDVRGRRIAARSGVVAAPGALSIEALGSPPSGLYFARIVQGAAIAHTRVAWTR